MATYKEITEDEIVLVPSTVTVGELYNLKMYVGSKNNSTKEISYDSTGITINHTYNIPPATRWAQCYIPTQKLTSVPSNISITILTTLPVYTITLLSPSATGGVPITYREIVIKLANTDNNTSPYKITIRQDFQTRTLYCNIKLNIANGELPDNGYYVIAKDADVGIEPVTSSTLTIGGDITKEILTTNELLLILWVNMPFTDDCPWVYQEYNPERYSLYNTKIKGIQLYEKYSVANPKPYVTDALGLTYTLLSFISDIKTFKLYGVYNVGSRNYNIKLIQSYIFNSFTTLTTLTIDDILANTYTEDNPVKFEHSIVYTPDI